MVEFKNENFNGTCFIEDCSGHKIITEFENGFISESHNTYKSKLNPFILKCIEENRCTKSYTKGDLYPQTTYKCLTCNIHVCESCINICHKEHKTTIKHPVSQLVSLCNCPNDFLCLCADPNINKTNKPKIHFHELLPEKYRVYV